MIENGIRGGTLSEDSGKDAHEPPSPSPQPPVVLPASPNESPVEPPLGADVALLLAIATEVHRRQRLRRLTARLVFVTVFGASTVLARRLGEELAILEAVEQHFCSPPHSCYAVLAPHEVRPWLQKVFLPTAFWQETAPVQSFHSSACRLSSLQLTEATAEECTAAYLRGSHRIIAPARFRQVVVEESRSGRYSGGESSWPAFANGKVRKSGLCTEIGQHHCRYREDLPRLIGSAANYGRGGFVLDLPTGSRSWTDAWDANFGDAARHADGDDMWLPRGTRAFSAELLLHTARLDMLTLVRILFEFLPSGRVQPTLQVSSIQAKPYDDFTNTVAMLVDVLFALSLGVYALLVAWAFIRQRRCGMLRLWNLPELLNLLLHLWAAGRWILYVADDRRGLLQDSSKDALGFPDIERLISLSEGTSQIAAANLAFACFAIMIDLQAIRRLSKPMAVLRRATAALLPLALCLALATLGFAACGHWLLGSQVCAFRSFPQAVATLLLAFFGSVDYPRLNSAAPTASPLYVTVWVLLVLLAMAGMLTCVIVEAFESIRAEDKRRLTSLSSSGRGASCEALAALVNGSPRSAAGFIGHQLSGLRAWNGLRAWTGLTTTSSKDANVLGLCTELNLLRRLGARLAADGAAMASLGARLDAGVDRISTPALASLLQHGSGCRQRDLSDVEAKSLAAALHRLSSHQEGSTDKHAVSPRPDLAPAEASAKGMAAATAEAKDGEVCCSSGLADSKKVEMGWSREVDEDVLETLNMLRFEVLALSDSIAKCEETSCDQEQSTLEREASPMLPACAGHTMVVSCEPMRCFAAESDSRFLPFLPIQPRTEQIEESGWYPPTPMSVLPSVKEHATSSSRQLDSQQSPNSRNSMDWRSERPASEGMSPMAPLALGTTVLGAQAWQQPEGPGCSELTCSAPLPSSTVDRFASLGKSALASPAISRENLIVPFPQNVATAVGTKARKLPSGRHPL